jgi:hypothetical protein
VYRYELDPRENVKKVNDIWLLENGGGLSSKRSIR